MIRNFDASASVHLTLCLTDIRLLLGVKDVTTQLNEFQSLYIKCRLQGNAPCVVSKTKYYTTYVLSHKLSIRPFLSLIFHMVLRYLNLQVEEPVLTGYPTNIPLAIALEYQYMVAS
jgi:hypothetical protein